MSASRTASPKPIKNFHLDFKDLTGDVYRSKWVTAKSKNHAEAIGLAMGTDKLVELVVMSHHDRLRQLEEEGKPHV